MAPRSDANLKETQARREHDEALRAEDKAAMHRFRRDQLVVDLRNLNSAYYTHARLATIVRCSPELIAHILRAARKKG